LVVPVFRQILAAYTGLLEHSAYGGATGSWRCCGSAPDPGAALFWTRAADDIVQTPHSLRYHVCVQAELKIIIEIFSSLGLYLTLEADIIAQFCLLRSV